ncbi:MAG TPA: tyrosine-type recombinase/integrase [Rhodocyclaceae bacterium]|jgi:integrase
MLDTIVEIPASITSLSSEEKHQWPVSIAIAPTGERIIVSRYGDDVWDFWPYIPQENKSNGGKQIKWAYRLPDGVLLTDPKHNDLLEACKDLIWSLYTFPIPGRRHPRMSTLVSMARGPLRKLLSWMNQRGMTQFREMENHTQQYAHWLRGQNSTRTALSNLRAIDCIYQQRNRLSDAITIHPWEFETIADLSGESTRPNRYKPQTPLIPDLIYKRLADVGIDYIRNRADHILMIRDAIAAKNGKKVRNGKQFISTLIAQEAGYQSARHHSNELATLRTSCYILIALFSGIRDSELLSLGTNCLSPFTTQDGTNGFWLHGTLYKTTYRPKKWLVPPIIEEVINVLEKISSPMRVELVAEENQLQAIPNKTKSQIKRLHQVSTQKTKLFVAKSPKQNNKIWVHSTHTSQKILARFCEYTNILGADGKPYPLKPHQFRRTYAYNYAKSELGDLLYLQEHFGHTSLDMTMLYEDGGTDDYEADTDLIAMIAAEKNSRQTEILGDILESDAPLAAGSHWIGEWRRMVRTAKNKETLIEELSGTLSLTGTGHSWCAGSAKGTGCGARCIFEPDMCTECNWSLITQEHLPVWKEIADQQETILACDDIGEPGKQMARRIHEKALATIAKLEGRPQ